MAVAKKRTAKRTTNNDKFSYKTKIVEVPISQCVQAPWNYKNDLSPEEAAKLRKSIQRDGSPGVMAVREIARGKYEFIDGNHRLQVLQEMGIDKLRVENFGNLKQADAVLIARRRNAQYAKADPAKWGVLLRDVVSEEISLAEAATVTTETEEELMAAIKMLEYDWSKGDGAEDGTGKKAPRSYNNAKDFIAISMQLPRPLFNRFEAAKKATGSDSDVELMDKLLSLYESE